MKKYLKLLIELSPIISASAIALKFKPPKKEVFNFNNPLNEEKYDMDDLEYQHMLNEMTSDYWEHRAGKATRFPNANACDKGNKTNTLGVRVSNINQLKEKDMLDENKQLKYDTQNKIEEIEQQIELMIDLQRKFPSHPDQFEKRIMAGYDTDLRLALSYTLSALETVQLFLDSPLKKMNSDRSGIILTSISDNIKELALHLSIYDSFYPRKMQYSIKDIITELNCALNFLQDAEEEGMLLISDSTNEGSFNYWDNQTGKATNYIVKAGRDLSEWGQQEYVEPNILVKNPSESSYAFSKLGQSSEDAILSNHLKIEDIPQKYRKLDDYIRSFECAREISVDRYIAICRLLLNDIDSFGECSAMTRREGIDLLIRYIIKGFDYFIDHRALDDFMIEQEKTLGEIGIFHDPNYSAEGFNRNVEAHSKKGTDLLLTDEEQLKTLYYISRRLRRSQNQGSDSLIIRNSRYFKKQRRAYKYLIEHIDELRGSSEIREIWVTEACATIYIKYINRKK